MWETVIPAAVGFLSNAMSATASTNIAREQNEYNAASVREANAQNERLTREQWARDDSSMQRAVADVQRAGFSPLAALGNMAPNSSPSSIYQSDKQDRGAEIQARQQATMNNIAIAQALVQNKLTEAQIEHTKAETRATNADADLKEHDYKFFKNSVIPSSFTRETFGQVVSLLANGEEVSTELINNANKLLAKMLPQNVFDALADAGNGNPIDGAINLVGDDKNPVSMVNKIKDKINQTLNAEDERRRQDFVYNQNKASEYSHPKSQPKSRLKKTYNKQ